MLFPQLQPAPEELHRVIVLNQQSPGPSIDYEATDLHEIYYINRPLPIFAGYLKSLLAKGPATVLLMHTTFTNTIKLVQALAGPELNKEPSIERFKQDVARFQHNGEPSENGSFPEVPLLSGQNDVPLAFDLCFVLGQHQLEPDVLSAESIKLQQYMRLISLVHGGKLVVVDDVGEVAKSPMKLLATLEPADLAPKPILEVDGGDMAAAPVAAAGQDIRLALYVPSAWDSANKVLLLAKLAIYLDEDSGLLTTELLCMLFIAKYRSYCDDEMTLLDLVLPIAPSEKPKEPEPERKVATMDDLLAAMKPKDST